jgi:hypothetical protein
MCTNYIHLFTDGHVNGYVGHNQIMLYKHILCKSGNTIVWSMNVIQIVVQNFCLIIADNE